MYRIITSLAMILAASVSAQTKDKALGDYLAVFTELRTLAQEYQHQELAKATYDAPEDLRRQKELQSRIDSIISAQLSADQLFRVGTAACLAAYPGEAGHDIPYDRVFQFASGRCARLLSERAGPEAASYLDSMQHICGRDGGEHLMYRELIEQQKQLPRPR